MLHRRPALRSGPRLTSADAMFAFRALQAHGCDVRPFLAGTLEEVRTRLCAAWRKVEAKLARAARRAS